VTIATLSVKRAIRVSSKRDELWLPIFRGFTGISVDYDLSGFRALMDSVYNTTSIPDALFGNVDVARNGEVAVDLDLAEVQRVSGENFSRIAYLPGCLITLVPVLTSSHLYRSTASRS
jgi:hypothetical protein